VDNLGKHSESFKLQGYHLYISLLSTSSRYLLDNETNNFMTFVGDKLVLVDLSLPYPSPRHSRPSLKCFLCTMEYHLHPGESFWICVS
jgi:hypothetical protein